jgi:hypothetical protein
MFLETKATLQGVETFDSALDVQKPLVLHDRSTLVLAMHLQKLLQQLDYGVRRAQKIVGLSDFSANGARVDGGIWSQMFV